MVFPIQRDQSISMPENLTKVRMKIVRPLNVQVAGLSSNPNGSLRSFESVLRSSEAPVSANSTPSEKWIEYTIKANDTLWTLAVKRFHVNVEDLIRDNGIEDPRKIQPGQKIRVRIPTYPRQQEVVASWYGQDHHGKPMANGETFDMGAATIAHKELPLGTRVELENPATGEKARAVVTDRGPYIAGRDVDLSRGLARKLSLEKKGVGSLVMRVLG